MRLYATIGLTDTHGQSNLLGVCQVNIAVSQRLWQFLDGLFVIGLGGMAAQTCTRLLVLCTLAGPSVSSDIMGHVSV